jgi:hypothetical protein
MEADALRIPRDVLRHQCGAPVLPFRHFGELMNDFTISKVSPKYLLREGNLGLISVRQRRQIKGRPFLHLQFRFAFNVEPRGLVQETDLGRIQAQSQLCLQLPL